MPRKMPGFIFFTGDWLKDPNLTMCRPETRGVWIDAICAMHELGTGELTGTPDDLARVCRCSPAAFARAKDDLHKHKAADVTSDNDVVTLICRRMQRQVRERQVNLRRQHRFRGKAEEPDSNERITPDITPVKPLESTNPPPAPPAGGDPPFFVSWWSEYPKHRRHDRSDCLRRWKARKLEEIGEAIVDATRRWKLDRQWRTEEGKFVPLAKTYLNQSRWESAPDSPAGFSGGPNVPAQKSGMTKAQSFVSEMTDEQVSVAVAQYLKEYPSLNDICLSRLNTSPRTFKDFVDWIYATRSNGVELGAA